MTKEDIKALAASCALIIAVMFMVFSLNGGLSDFAQSVGNRQMTFIEDTIRKYAVQCYALEGFFPKDLSYLRDNYGLYLNDKKYVYHYNYIGENLLPEIYVFELTQ
ncbi:MAG: hypothetical protein GX061_08505 [Eubacteriaceae bacterium]|nr:hypothetical protein [Eubacteriaceae bacterium]